MENESLSTVDKIRELIQRKKKLSRSFFSDEDSYTVGGSGAGSPGMSSVGSIGGNTNRGLGPLPEDHHQISLNKVKQYLRNKS
jgi:hypothetical protein